MKSALMTIALACCSAAAFSQISLEHNYRGYNRVSVINLEGDGNKYIALDTTTKNIQTFNTDHSLWKTVSIASAGVTKNYYGYASKNLFNSDGKIEMLISVNAGSGVGLQLINEDGTVLNTFPNAFYAIVTNVSGLWKMIVGGSFWDDVYALPGTYRAGMPSIDPGTDPATATLFPNPVISAATLRYQLPVSVHQASISIYNSAGALVRQMEVTDQFTDVTIAKDLLPAGTYTYTISTTTGTISTAKFQIQ